MTQDTVYAVVLNWNNGPDTLKCIGSLIQSNYPDLSILVIDNASSDNSLDVIIERYPEIEVLRNIKNFGFAGGNNTGISHALMQGAQYILLLNNDAEVDTTTILKLVDRMKDDEAAGVVGAKIFYASDPEIIWFAGGIFDCHSGNAVHLGKDERDRGQFDHISEIDYATGCAMLVKAQVFKSIGLLDDRYFLYYEEIDFCMRARQAGFKVLFAPYAKVWHKVSASTGGKKTALGHYYFTRNRLFLCRKWLKGTEWMAFLRKNIGSLIKDSLEIWGSVDRDKAVKIKALWIGLIHYVINRSGEGPKWITREHQPSTGRPDEA